MTWKTLRHRGETLRTVIAHADYTRDGRLPMQLPGVEAAFVDETDLLGALQLKWYTRLSGHLERARLLEDDPTEAVVAGWRSAADQLPGVRAVLDQHRLHPLDATMARVMEVATAKEHALLAAHAGLAAPTDPAAPRLGLALEERARAGWRHTQSDPARRRGLVGRIRAALAA